MIKIYVMKFSKKNKNILKCFAVDLQRERERDMGGGVRERENPVSK